MSGSGLLGRQRENEALTRLVHTVRDGSSQVLVVRGEAGIGKTALLEAMVAEASGCRVDRAAGVESEMELPYAGLHQLCGPHLDRLAQLPGKQREALGTAFRLRSGATPDPIVVGLAALTLLSLVAESEPLICLVDDAQWLDQASADALEFVARRLAAEPVGIVLALRDGPEPRFDGLPTSQITGLDHDDAAALLDSAAPGGLDPRVRERILAECHGNPLALLELPRGLTHAELAFGGAAESETTPLVQRLEREFLRQFAPLPPRIRRLLLVAAAEPVGDPALLLRAAARLGIRADPATAPNGDGSADETAGLVSIGDRVRFRHPLVRSAIYRAAGLAERREAHRALADSTDPETDRERRAWHLARAAVGPDEAVAAELERCADSAAVHGGIAAAAAFLDQAAALTPDPTTRVRRSLAGAQAKAHAGAFRDALALLATAESGSLGQAERAHVEVLRAQISFAAERGNEALPLLISAARRLEPLDPQLARDTYLDAMSAALFAGRLAVDAGAPEVAEAVRATPPPVKPRKNDVLLDGLATLFSDGYPAAAPTLHKAVQAFATEDLTMEEALRSAWLSIATASALWDDTDWDDITRRHLGTARSSGALSALPLALDTRTVVEIFRGDLAAAAALVEERHAVAEATRSGLAPYGEIALLAARGQAERVEPMIRDCLGDVTARGEGVGINLAQWSRAVLCNGLGRYPEAVGAAREAAADPRELGLPQWALAELIEAAVHNSDTRAATMALEELSPMAHASGTDWALGVEASRRALVEGNGDLHDEAVERLARTRMGFELARARLLYGEWLRREGRRVDARVELRAAHQAFSTMGADAFAGRTARELQATGETIRRRTVESPGKLTAQEAHIARLAAEGLTNPEIGAALYISPRTVEWHLRRIYSKLGVGNRRRLRQTLAG
ncbi:AAA family ATPase [Actinoplanes solisilvae]|uniref:AAA family ATPase n=1 Tax=Actinoplanes solisilvae TaxID=2486853 RepID=UPI00196B222A|nr:AAA family ATPase [Actinoplanes solisilvae]